MNIRILVPLIGYLSLITSSHSYAITAFIAPKSNMQASISNAHKKAFDIDRLYQNPLDQTSIKEWNNAISELQPFVSRYSLNNTKLMNLYRDLKRTNNELIKTINATYTTLFKSKRPTEANRSTVIKKTKDTLATIETRMMAAQDFLNGLDIEPTDIGIKKVRDALLIVVLCLELTATKAGKDIDKEISLR